MIEETKSARSYVDGCFGIRRWCYGGRVCGEVVAWGRERTLEVMRRRELADDGI